MVAAIERSPLNPGKPKLRRGTGPLGIGPLELGPLELARIMDVRPSAGPRPAGPLGCARRWS